MINNIVTVINVLNNYIGLEDPIKIDNGMDRVSSAITRSVIYAVDIGLDQIVLKKYILYI